MAEGLQAGLWAGGGGGKIRRRSARVFDNGDEVRRRRPGPGEGNPHGADRVVEEREGPVHAEGSGGHAKGAAGATRAAGDGLSGAGTAVAGAAQRRARRPIQRAGRVRQICDQREGCFRGGRRPARAKPRRLGLQRRPRRGARMRPLSDGPDEFAVRACLKSPRKVYFHVKGGMARREFPQTT
jgi:hypothetical protein